MIRYVAGFLFDESLQHVALILKHKPDWLAGTYNGIGGKVEPGEDWLEAMIREFEEETGVRVEHWTHTVTLQNDLFECRFFMARSNGVFQVKTQENEPISIHKVADVPTLPTVPNVQWLVPLQLDPTLSKPFCLWYGA
jgi:8-oxo-dGTP pyrophosphatase MutT (NUDIX family)